MAALFVFASFRLFCFRSLREEAVSVFRIVMYLRIFNKIKSKFGLSFSNNAPSPFPPNCLAFGHE